MVRICARGLAGAVMALAEAQQAAPRLAVSPSASLPPHPPALPRCAWKQLPAIGLHLHADVAGHSPGGRPPRVPTGRPPLGCQRHASSVTGVMRAKASHRPCRIWYFWYFQLRFLPVEYLQQNFSKWNRGLKRQKCQTLSLPTVH